MSLRLIFFRALLTRLGALGLYVAWFTNFRLQTCVGNLIHLRRRPWEILVSVDLHDRCMMSNVDEDGDVGTGNDQARNEERKCCENLVNLRQRMHGVPHTELVPWVVTESALAGELRDDEGSERIQPTYDCVHDVEAKGEYSRESSPGAGDEKEPIEGNGSQAQHSTRQ